MAVIDTAVAGCLKVWDRFSDPFLERRLAGYPGLPY